MDKKAIAQLIIARLDGNKVGRRFRYYQSLARKGIGGFIIFGGEAREVRDGIRRLQKEAEYPLFIASDLEQGLGQQMQGGTLFPPAMAIASVIDKDRKEDLRLLRKAIDIMAIEAKAVGINVILAPVADVNTNPENPIICTRSFSDNPEKVAWFVKEYVKGIQRHGLIACAKHFPGHGDTAIDSHLKPPIVKADINRLKGVELYPFSRAIGTGVRMVMIGHLKVPAIDPVHLSTFSKNMVKGLLKDKMGFKGLVITDAMNMKAVTKWGDEACLMALRAGADIILHPDSPERVIDFLYERKDTILPEIERSLKGISKAKKTLKMSSLSIRTIGKRSHLRIARMITEKSLKINRFSIGNPFSGDGVTLLTIDDDSCRSGKPFNIAMKRYFKGLRSIYVDNKYKGGFKNLLNSFSGQSLIVAVYSRVSAYKGRALLSRRLGYLLKEAVKVARFSLVVGFCCPYILRDIKADFVVEAYSDSDIVQGYSAELLYQFVNQ